MTTLRSDACFAGGRLAAGDVRQMFADLVPRYDLLNHVLSLGLDLLWRRAAACSLPRGAELHVADLCTGTGDMAAAVARRLGPRARIVGVDFCEAMIRRARRKHAGRWGLEFLVGDATNLPLADGSCDAVTMAFGLRNVGDIDRALAEMFRVLRCGGRLLLLEFCRPRGRLWPAIFGFYFRRILPIVGRVASGHQGAYTYLPASVERFADPTELVARLRDVGAVEAATQRLPGGVAAVTTARKRS